MRLTKYHKDSFVRRVMQDVPQIDYQELAQKNVQAEAASQLPPLVKSVFDDKNLRSWLKAEFVGMPGGYLSSVYVVRDFSYKKSAGLNVILSDFETKHVAQRKQRFDIEQKITSLIFSCSTVGKALKLLPEFKEYLPKDDEKPIENLPSATNVVVDLMNAGWKQKVNLKGDL